MHVSTPHSGASNKVVRRFLSGLLVNRDFSLLWLGKSVSLLGDTIFIATLIVWITTDLARGEPWSSLAVSGVMVAFAIPQILVSPVAGVFVDRWDKRRTMIGMNAVSACLVVLLLVVEYLSIPLAWRLGAIYAVVLLVNACGRFIQPASTALLGDIVEERYLTRASSLNQTAFSIAIMVGPAIGAPMAVAFGPDWAFLIDACSFLISLLLILAIRAPRATSYEEVGQRSGFKRDLATGIRFFVKTPVLRVMAISIALVTFGEGAMNTLEIFFLTHNLHSPAAMYGFLELALGGGMVLGSAITGLLAQRIGLTRVLWSALVVFGTLTIVFSRLSSFGPGVIVIFLLGLAAAAPSVAIGPLILRETPRDLVGRASSTLNPIINVTSIVGAVIGGFVYSTLLRNFRSSLFGIGFGPLDTIFLVIGTCALCGGLYAMVNLHGRPVGGA